MTRRAGFSLIEVLCALIILGVGVAGIARAITMSLRSAKDAQYRTTAALLAASQIELLRAEGYLYEGESEGEFEEPVATYGWKLSVEETTESGLYAVQVEVLHVPTGETLYELETRLFEMPYESPFDTLTTTTGTESERRDRWSGRRRDRVERRGGRRP